MFETEEKIPQPLKRKIKEIIRRYTVTTTLYSFVDYLKNNGSSEYDEQFAQEMEEAYERYLERRKNKKMSII